VWPGVVGRNSRNYSGKGNILDALKFSLDFLQHGTNVESDISWLLVGYGCQALQTTALQTNFLVVGQWRIAAGRLPKHESRILSKQGKVAIAALSRRGRAAKTNQPFSNLQAFNPGAFSGSGDQGFFKPALCFGRHDLVSFI